ncbi:MAG: DUF296 domain-containing protein [Methanomicrobiales archaeon]|nr:DUF296 domain-containing protein [Methanomicrobiales archaeon]
MQYAECRIGRVFAVRIDDGEELHAALRTFFEEHRIAAATIQILGALRDGTMVTGPLEAVMPPTPHYEEVTGGWEVIGFGTVFPGGDGPALHLHAAVGRGRESRAGCLRGEAHPYLVVEAVIMELDGIRAARKPDSRTGVVLPVFQGRS